MTTELFFPLYRVLTLAHHALVTPTHCTGTTEPALVWMGTERTSLHSSGHPLPAAGRPGHHAPEPVRAVQREPGVDSATGLHLITGGACFAQVIPLFDHTSGWQLLDALEDADRDGARWLIITVTDHDYTLGCQ